MRCGSKPLGSRRTTRRCSSRACVRDVRRRPNSHHAPRGRMSSRECSTFARSTFRFSWSSLIKRPSSTNSFSNVCLNVSSTSPRKPTRPLTSQSSLMNSDYAYGSERCTGRRKQLDWRAKPWRVSRRRKRALFGNMEDDQIELTSGEKSLVPSRAARRRQIASTETLFRESRQGQSL